MKLHIIKGHVSSVYLAEYADKLLLLDGCSRPDVKTVLDFIRKNLARPAEDLKLVMVTHMHPDHAGGAKLFKKLTGCQLAYANNSQQHWYAGVKGVLQHNTDVLLTHWLAMQKGKPLRNLWFKRKVHFDIYLNDGDKLPNFADWQVLHTPGHTSMDLSLYHKQSESIYVADLIIKTKGSYYSPIPVSFPELYRASLDRIFALKPKHIYLAHSGEALLTEQDFTQLYQSIPSKAITALNSLKAMYLPRLSQKQKK